MKNKELREYAKKKKVKLWEIGEKLGKDDCNFSRYLRHERTREELDKLMKIVDEIAAERKDGE